MSQAADELVRLQDLNRELLSALRVAQTAIEYQQRMRDDPDFMGYSHKRVCEAIQKGENYGS